MPQQDSFLDDIDFDLDDEDKREDVQPVQNTPEEVKENNHEETVEDDEDNNVSGNLYGPAIPKQDTAYTEVNEVMVNGSTPMDVKYNYPNKPTVDYEIDTWNAIDNFENKVWSKKADGIKTGFNLIDKGFDHGLHPGFIIIAGEANIGKSIVLSQMAHQIVENNDNVFVMDFSLDDAMPDKLSRIVACSNKILINSVKNPKAYTKYPLMLARRKQGMIKLRTMINKYKPYDASFSTYIEDIEEEIIKMKVNFDGTDTQLVVCIDSFHDLNIKKSPNLQDKQKYDLLAQWCADISIKYDIILLCTGELRKLNSTARPTPDALRELTIYILLYH